MAGGGEVEGPFGDARTSGAGGRWSGGEVEESGGEVEGPLRSATSERCSASNTMPYFIA